MPAHPLRILVLSRFEPGNANVIRDFLFAFNAYSQHRYYYVFNCATLGEDPDLSRFDVILLFWSLSPIGSEFSPALRRRIRAAAAVKVAFFQDEHREARARNEAMRQLGVRVVFTAVHERDHETFYPRALVDTLEATYTVLTGYVPAYLEGQPVDRGERPVDVGYRSRVVPFSLGDLGREKAIIADRFLRICRESGLRADISVRERDRIYGKGWVRFLRRSRCVLGTASGASVIDFDGRIRQACDLHLAQCPDASYEEVKARYFAGADGTVVIDTVSPRVFEGAALHCTMVHHDGAYGGVIEPNRHYIPVRRDYSNIADVVDQIRDKEYCRVMAATAHRDLVASGRYSYRRFAQEFDERLERHTAQSSTARGLSRAAFYASRYRWSEPLILPRGAGHVLGPATALAVTLAGTLAEKLPHRYSRATSILLLEPLRFIQQSHAAWMTIAATPPLRALLAAYWRTADARAVTPLTKLAVDLLRIDIVRRARGRIAPCPPFGIDLEFAPQAGALILRSVCADTPASTAEPLPGEVERALAAGRIRRIIWSHSLPVDRVPCPRWPLRSIPVALSDGVYDFPALSAVCAHAPGTAAALRTILTGERSPSGKERVMVPEVS